MTRNIFDDFENNRDYTIERLDGIASAISLFTVSSEIKFVYFNRAADAMFGYAPGGLMEATADDPLNILHPENEDQFYSEIIATMRDGKFFNYNCRILCGDNTYKWAKISAELVRQSGGVLYFHGVMSEIPEPANIMLQGLHALIASGSEVDRTALSHMLESKGGTCDVLQSGVDALDKFEASAPDFYQCIFIGGSMTDMNGPELIKDVRICKHPQAEAIPLIFIAEAGTADMLNEVRDIGVSYIVTKPLDPEKIAVSLKSMLNK